MDNNVTQLISYDPWSSGIMITSKNWLWGYYWISSYIGLSGCILLIYLVIKNPKRTSSDIFSAGIASAINFLSITCGSQCLANLIIKRFVGADTACTIEAVLHVSSILSEFYCTTAMSIGFYFETTRKRKITQRTAFVIVVTIWLTCTIVTIALIPVSPIYLMGGLYCFFSFGSPTISLFLAPGLVISLATNFITHYKIAKFYSKMLPKVVLGSIKILGHGNEMAMTTQKDIWIKHFRLKSTLYFLALLVGWGPAAATTVFELFGNRATNFLSASVGIGGVSFSWWMILIFFYTSPIYKAKAKQLFSNLLCCSRKERWNSIHSLSRLSRLSRHNSKPEDIVSEPEENLEIEILSVSPEVPMETKYVEMDNSKQVETSGTQGDIQLIETNKTSDHVEIPAGSEDIQRDNLEQVEVSSLTSQEEILSNPNKVEISTDTEATEISIPEKVKVLSISTPLGTPHTPPEIISDLEKAEVLYNSTPSGTPNNSKRVRTPSSL